MRYFFWGVFFYSISHAISAEVFRVQEADLARLVREKNGLVAASKVFVQAAESKTGHWARSYLPALSIETGGEAFQAGRYSVLSQPFGLAQLKINLFRGGRDWIEEDIRQTEVTLELALAHESYVVELTTARKLFWHIVYQKELLKILNEALQENEKNLAAAKKRISAGLTTDTDRIEFEIALRNFQQEIEKVNLSLLNLQKELAISLGIPAGMPTAGIEITDSMPHEHDESLFQVKFDEKLHYQTERLNAERRAAELRAKKANRWWAPSLDAYAVYGLYTQRERDFVSLQDRYEAVGGVKLTFELFDSLQSKAEATHFKLLSDGLDYQYQQATQQLKNRFNSVQKEMKLTHNLLHAAETNAEQGKLYLSRTLAEYTRGVKNSPDVLGAIGRYVEYRRRVLDLKHDYQNVKTELMALLGQ